MTVKYVHWQDDSLFLGYLQDFPDFVTQGETEAELRENLIDIYLDITGGLVQNVRRVDELVVPA
ncbi:MAG: type II toxin-antitoxin system HicB family antitoxin [Spirochaetota bacterium]